MPLRCTPKLRKSRVNSHYRNDKSTSHIRLLSHGGGGSHRRTCLCFAFPCFAGKYREILALEAGDGEAAVALANNFKSFLSIP